MLPRTTIPVPQARPCRAIPALLAGFIAAATALPACEAKIAARDPQAVRAFEAAELARKTPWAFPSPGDAVVATPTSAGPDVSPTASTPAGSEPSPSASPGPTPPPMPAPVVGMTPPAPRTFKIGEEATIFVTFALPVVWTGSPAIVLKSGGKAFAFEPQLGLGTETIAFRYMVKPGDDARALSLEPGFDLSGGTLSEKNGGEVPPALPATDLGALAFDGTQERASSVAPPGDGLYTDSFEVAVEFPAPVTLRGTPWLSLLVGNDTQALDDDVRRAPAVGVVGGNKVVFRYTVQSGDRDVDDGVVFQKALRPGAEDPLGDAVLGSNGNPVADSLLGIPWPARVIKVAHVLPDGAYAHYRAEPGRLYAAGDAALSACNAGASTSWSEGAAAGCWQDSIGRAPFLVAQAPEDTAPKLVIASQPFAGGALRFSAGDALRFPARGSPMIAANAARFVALAFRLATSEDGVVLLSRGPEDSVTLHPAAGEVRFTSAGRSGTAKAPLEGGGVLILGLLDDGARSQVLHWNGAKAVRRDVESAPPTSGVFVWPLEGTRFGGRVASQPAFAGDLGEVLVYGSLTPEEQGRALCYLATRHGGHSGACP